MFCEGIYTNFVKEKKDEIFTQVSDSQLSICDLFDILQYPTFIPVLCKGNIDLVLA